MKWEELRRRRYQRSSYVGYDNPNHDEIKVISLRKDETLGMAATQPLLSYIFSHHTSYLSLLAGGGNFEFEEKLMRKRTTWLEAGEIGVYINLIYLHKFLQFVWKTWDTN